MAFCVIWDESRYNIQQSVMSVILYDQLVRLGELVMRTGFISQCV